MRREQSNMLPYKPVHRQIIECCERSMILGETDFPVAPSTKTVLHYRSMLSTDRQPTGVMVNDGRHQCVTSCVLVRHQLCTRCVQCMY